VRETREGDEREREQCGEMEERKDAFRIHVYIWFDDARTTSV